MTVERIRSRDHATSFARDCVAAIINEHLGALTRADPAQMFEGELLALLADQKRCFDERVEPDLRHVWDDARELLVEARRTLAPDVPVESLAAELSRAPGFTAMIARGPEYGHESPARYREPAGPLPVTIRVSWQGQGWSGLVWLAAALVALELALGSLDVLRQPVSEHRALATGALLTAVLAGLGCGYCFLAAMLNGTELQIAGRHLRTRTWPLPTRGVAVPIEEVLEVYLRGTGEPQQLRAMQVGVRCERRPPLAVKARDPKVAWLILGLLHRGLTAAGWRGPVRFS